MDLVDFAILGFPSPSERDVQVFGTRVASFSYIDGSFMVTLSGGQALSNDSADVLPVDEIDLRFGWESSTDEERENAKVASELYAKKLSEWQESRALLSLISAPQTPFYLVESSTSWIPVPRTVGE